MTHDEFDLDEWLESIQGETIKVTERRGLGPEVPSPGANIHVYCMNCDGFRMMVCDEDIYHCPECGETPGIMEHSVSKKEVEYLRVVEKEGKLVTEFRRS